MGFLPDSLRTRLPRQAWIVFFSSLCLGAWGIQWCLPSRDRLLKVLPPEVDSPQFVEHLASTWKARYESFGAEPMLSPLLWAAGFSRTAVVPAGWKLPPEQLTNSTRSFFLRTGYEDEANVLVCLSRIRPDRLEFNPKIYTAYGTAYFLALGAWIALTSAVSPVVLRPSIAFYLSHLDKLAWLYLSGRLFSAALCALGALFTFLLGRRYWGERAGLWAGLFFAAVPGNALLTHFMKPGPLGFVALMGVFFYCAEILDGRDERSQWLWAGIWLGLAAGATNYLWDGGILLILTLLLRARRPDASWRRAARLSVGSVAAALAVYLLTNPFLILEYKTAWPMMMTSASHASRDPNAIWQWAFIGLPKALTIPVAAWAYLGLFAKAQRADPKRVLVSAALVFYVGTAWMLEGGAQLMSIRHSPAAFFACLSAGCLAAEWTRSSAWQARWPSRLAQGAAVLALVYAAANSLALDYNYHLESGRLSTKQRAGDWIEREVPAGSELGFFRLPQPGNAPYFHWNRYQLRFVEAAAFIQGGSVDLLPRTLVLTVSGADIPPALRAALDRDYVLARSFEPFEMPGAAFPMREAQVNPKVIIFTRKPSSGGGGA